MIDRIVGLLFCQIEQRLRAQGILDLFERLGVGGLFFQDFDDVKTVLRSNQVGDLARSEGKRRFFEFGNRLPLANPAQIPAFFLGTRVFRVLFGQFVELGAFLGLL